MNAPKWQEQVYFKKEFNNQEEEEMTIEKVIGDSLASNEEATGADDAVYEAAEDEDDSEEEQKEGEVKEEIPPQDPLIDVPLNAESDFRHAPSGPAFLPLNGVGLVVVSSVRFIS